jgi:uncharacterized protein with HEPN domain
VTRADDQRVVDILTAADGLARRLRVGFETWERDEDLRLVTERLVEIIGEAARSLSQEYRLRHDEIDWSGFAGLRNVLIHAYHRIDAKLLWTAATVDVPNLAARLRSPGEG